MNEGACGTVVGCKEVLYCTSPVCLCFVHSAPLSLLLLLFVLLLFPFVNSSSFVFLPHCFEWQDRFPFSASLPTRKLWHLISFKLGNHKLIQGSVFRRFFWGNLTPNICRKSFNFPRISAKNWRNCLKHNISADHVEEINSFQMDFNKVPEYDVHLPTAWCSDCHALPWKWCPGW